MTRGQTIRLRILARAGEASRAIDVTSTTPLDVVAQALRAVSSEDDGPQYRMLIGDDLYGNPRGRSHPDVRPGRTIPLEKALGRASSFHFRSDLRRKTGHQINVENVFRSIWAPEDHPLLVDVDGEMPPARTPTPWDIMKGVVDSEEQAESRARRNIRRIDEIVRHYLLELALVRNPRRGPIRSHQSGRRGWRNRVDRPSDPATDALYRAAAEALEHFTFSGNGYYENAYSHFEQRPCLLEHVALETIRWCTRHQCPGCHTNHIDDHLFGGSEVWATTRGAQPPAPPKHESDVVNLHEKPKDRVTVRVSHPAGDRAAAIAALKTWDARVDSDDRERLGIWIARDGDSWRGPGERTAVLFQPADIPGPPGWTPAE